LKTAHPTPSILLESQRAGAPKVSASALYGIDVAEGVGPQKKKEVPMDAQNQQRLETLLAAGIGFGLSRLLAERFIKDLVPEQRGITDDVTRALLRAGTTATAAVLASVIVRQAAKALG